MTKKAAAILAFISAFLTLTGCSETGVQPDDSSAEEYAQAESTYMYPETVSGVTAEFVVQTTAITEKLKDEDTDSTWSTAGSTQITLNGSTASVADKGASVSGGTVTISAAGTYVVSGKLSKGQILINASQDDLVRLVLNGVEITADTGAAIYAVSADKLVIILADGKTNTITDGTSYVYADAEKEEPNAAVFSKCDLTINGTGSLTVNGNFNHGVATKDDLVVVSGNITVNAVNSALRGKDSVTVLDGTFSLTSKEGDGIKTANNTDADKGWILIKGGRFTISAYNDGIQAENTLEIHGGSFDITSGGGWPGGSLTRGSHATSSEGVVSSTNPSDGSYKGIKSSGSVIVNGGEFTISSYDDAVHSNADITINDGTFTLQSGDDGIHADGTVTVNGGTINIKNSYEGIEGASISLPGGKISLYSTDDGLNQNSSSGLLTVTGGEVYINAGGDGIDANGSVSMTGGAVYVDGPTSSGDGAIDYQKQFTISGGILIAVDSGNMSQTPGTTSGQPSILLYFTGSQKAGTEISIQSADGKTLAMFTPQKDYRVAVISAAGMKIGGTYTLYSNGTKLCEVTLTSTVTSIDSTGAAYSGGMGSPGGGQRGMNAPGGGKRNTQGGSGI